MDVIKESAEHHFLTTLEKLKSDPGGWYGLRLALSRKINHDDMISTPAHIKGKLHKLENDSADWLEKVQAKAAKLRQTTLYRFRDFDIVLLTRANTDEAHKELQAIYREFVEELGEKRCTITNLMKDLSAYNKLCDRKFISAKLIESYHAMADSNKVASIDIRRTRHEDPVVMMVEDDRFTASYASHVLNKDYDLILARNGEEAIGLHIEHCPDIVFLDIHMPGLDGLETLKALKKVDPKAHIVMLSVDAVKSNIVKATDEGAASFLKKPFTRERIIGIVEKSPHVRDVKAKMKSPLLR